MAKYRVLELSFIKDRLVQVGDIVEYDGVAGPNLELLAAKKSKREEKPAEDEDAEE